MAEDDTQAPADTAVKDQDDERGEQTVSIEDVGPGRKRLTIEVPPQRIEDKIGDSYKRLQNDADIPGFRRGRAPLRLIERRFGSAVRDDVRGQLISDCYTQAVEDEKLEVIGEPDIKDLEGIELPDEGALTFSVEVEIAPSVTLPSLDAIPIQKQASELTDADVDTEVEQLCRRLGTRQEVRDEPLQPQDVIRADVRVLAGVDAADDAEELAHHESTAVHVPDTSHETRAQVAGLIVEDLGEKLAGKTVADVIRISMTGPPSHEDEKIKDQPITIVLRIDAIVRVVPIEMEQLLTRTGLADTDQLRQYMRGMAESRAEQRRQQAMRDQVRDYLMDKVDLDLPEGITSRQALRLQRRQAMELASAGVPEDLVELRLAEGRAQSEQAARQQLKAFFILNTAAKELDVEISDGMLNGAIANLAAEHGRRPEKLRQQLQRSGELEHLALMIREQVTLDQIINMADVSEVDATKDEQATEST